MGKRTFSKMRKRGKRTRRAGNLVTMGKSYADAVKGNAASLIDAAVPKTVTDNLPQNVVAGDCASIMAKAKKCEEANAAQAKDLMAAAAEKAKVAQDASTVVAAAKAVDKTVSAGPKLRKLSDAEKRSCQGQVRAGMYKDQAACELMKAKTAKGKGGKRRRRRGTKKGMRRKTARLAYSKRHGRGGRRTRR